MSSSTSTSTSSSSSSSSSASSSSASSSSSSELSTIAPPLSSTPIFELNVPIEANYLEEALKQLSIEEQQRALNLEDLVIPAVDLDEKRKAIIASSLGHINSLVTFIGIGVAFFGQASKENIHMYDMSVLFDLLFRCTQKVFLDMKASTQQSSGLALVAMQMAKYCLEAKQLYYAIHSLRDLTAKCITECKEKMDDMWRGTAYTFEQTIADTIQGTLRCTPYISQMLLCSPYKKETQVLKDAELMCKEVGADLRALFDQPNRTTAMISLVGKISSESGRQLFNYDNQRSILGGGPVWAGLTRPFFAHMIIFSYGYALLKYTSMESIDFSVSMAKDLCPESSFADVFMSEERVAWVHRCARQTNIRKFLVQSMGGYNMMLTVLPEHELAWTKLWKSAGMKIFDIDKSLAGFDMEIKKVMYQTHGTDRKGKGKFFGTLHLKGFPDATTPEDVSKWLSTLKEDKQTFLGTVEPVQYVRKQLLGSPKRAFMISTNSKEALLLEKVFKDDTFYTEGSKIRVYIPSKVQDKKRKTTEDPKQGFQFYSTSQ
eukprot:TRINITY_DN3956_c0_g1_i1.p1 TRINITY_DN3956_c0_g1~~TRINITY_DN3956_c0_g1_i1.p1  ORF type:complete len:544 (+),score=59.73 TRINITY_DN3956_c0_g1_i1:329-1960(+)